MIDGVVTLKNPPKDEYVATPVKSVVEESIKVLNTKLTAVDTLAKEIDERTKVKTVAGGGPK